MSDTDDLCLDLDAVSLGSCDPRFVAAGTTLPGRRRYLCYFLHRHLNFRLAETEGLAEVAYGRPTCDDGLPVVVWELPFGGGLLSPFWYVHLPSEEVARKIAADSMLVKAFLEVWGEGSSWEELCAAVAAYPQALRAPYAAADQSFRFVVEAWGQSLSAAEQLAIIDSLADCTALQGPVDLRSAAHRFRVVVVEDPQLDHATTPVLPQRYYLGREVAVNSGRADATRYELKRRRYLGPTSMDAELSFIMCALGCVRPGSIVVDPFVGTGSVLVAAAARGALTLGTDIDIRVLRMGKKDAAGRQVNAWTNFHDYALPPPLGLLRCDLHRPPLRHGLEGWAAAIVADPPYGVRAGGRKSRAVENCVVLDRATHIPSTAPYTLAECLRDLLELAAKALEVGGRLVYWVPAAPGYYVEEELPRHPALGAPLANCEQFLGGRYSRRLVVMRKERAYDAEAAAAHHAAQGPPTMAQDSMHEMVYAPRERGGREAAGKDGGSVGSGASGSRAAPGHPRFRCKVV